MKVIMSEDSKRAVSVSELPAAKKIIQYMKEDSETAADYAASAVRALCGCCDEVFKASAEIAKNGRVYDAYASGSGNLDVWINFIARADSREIVEGGAYLTDIWNITGDENDEIKEHAFLLRYKRS